MSEVELFERQLSGWGLAVDVRTRDTLLGYAELLARYDRANVIGTRDLRSILLDHVLDSMSCLLLEPLREARRVADIGSGGGLPGIPLAISLPEARFALYEATGKKARFLLQAVTELGLRNVEVHNVRVEEAARSKDHRGRYDVCAARAVAPLSVVVEYCLPLARTCGCVISMKGRKDDEEWEEGYRAARILGGTIGEEIQVPFLPEMEQKERRLVLLQKVAKTPERYPRKTGMPARKPLGRP